jgi:hypothetical protein
MSDLKPIGSEKLQGLEKIQRMMEIARFNEKLPTSVNESQKSEYSRVLADGHTYEIVKEKNGYIIKKGLNEGDMDYMEPMKNRRYFPSYSQALKRFNLLVKEMNSIHENDEEISLFGEQKKYVLKTPEVEKKKTEVSTDIENVPAPSPEPMPSPEMSEPSQSVDPFSSDEEEPMDGGDDFSSDDEMGDEDMGGFEDQEDEVEEPSQEKGGKVSFKHIQKLVGRLGQKVRQYNSEVKELSPQDTKYIINSILSALDLSVLSEDDVEQIMDKFDSAEGDESSSEEEGFEDDFGSEEENDDMFNDTEETPEEMGEGYGELLGSLGRAYTQTGMNARAARMTGTDEMKEIAEKMFKESKVEKVLTKYFQKTETEKLFESVTKNDKKRLLQEQIEKTMKSASSFFKTYEQEISSRKALKTFPNSSFIGKTINGDLVFETKDFSYKVSRDGQILMKKTPQQVKTLCLNENKSNNVFCKSTKG